MKFNFKKISAIATSVLMTGMTIGSAMAAGIKPSDLGGQGNFAIVYGATAHSLDQVQASNINEALKVDDSSPVTLDGDGDSFKIEKKNTKFNLLNSVNDVYNNNLDDEELTKLLEDVVYKDKAKTEFDVEQTIVLADHEIDIISDRKYNNEEPTFGITIPRSQAVFDYKIDFVDDQPELAKMDDSEISILGKTYYIFKADKEAITLLDSSGSQSIAETERDKKIIVGGKEYTVSVDVYADSKVRFTVNGETTGGLQKAHSEKLSDDSYIVVRDVFYAPKESGISSVDFSIGKGEIYLPKNGDVKVNGDKVDGLKSVYTLINSDKELQDLTLNWAATEKTWLTGAKGYQKMTFPVFEGAEYIFDGMTTSSDYDEFEILSGDDHLEYRTEIQNGELRLPVLYLNTAGTQIAGNGEYDKSILVVSGDDGVLKKETYTIDLGASLDTDNYFVVSYIDGDDGYTFAYEVDTIDDEDGVVLKGLTGESDVKLKTGRTIDREDLTFEATAYDESAGTATIVVTCSTGEVYDDVIVAKSNLVVSIPVAAGGTTSEDIALYEQEKVGGNLGDRLFEVTADVKEDEGIHVGSIDTATNIFNSKMYETATDDVYVAYVNSEIATPMELDKSKDLNEFVVKYSGEETYGNLYVAQAGVATSSGGSTGAMIFKDTESSAYAGKNLVIVGGSCVNSAAAKVLGVASDRGVPGCYADTGLSAGQFLIKKGALNGKTAIVVAGYEADDTVKAVQLLINKGVQEGKYNSATSEIVA